MRARSLISAAVLSGGLALAPHTAYSAAHHGTKSATNLVDYLCTSTAGVDTQLVTVSVELTMPTGAVTGQQLTIGWRGSYADGTTGLRAPAGGLSGVNLYAYASISDLPQLTSATGVQAIGTVAAGAVIPLPATTVGLKTTSRNSGTGSVKPAAINFGPKPQEPLIECEVLNKDALTADSLTVTSSTRSPSPSPSPTTTRTTSPSPTSTGTRPARTVTATVTAAEENPGVTRTPVGAADTGGGGTTGPDGRPLVATGSLILLAATSGLLLRRRVRPRAR
ncbi:hypothetical protein [Sphaerisporangium aureirubrum]|uniref:Peptidase n=1 Tax=Sphaerisporangium aureirubrum TaxID=1544736 RepID=A0ABW1NI95_9ACTN